MNAIETTAATPNTSTTPGSIRQVASDFQESARAAIPDVRRQLDATAEVTRDAAANVIDNLRCAARDAAEILRRDAHHSKHVAERYIGSNPWRSAAIIGAAGLLVGALLSRRR